jgi:release factor glutamine methyltransferase
VTARRLLADAAEAIAAIGAGNPRLEAELLLARALERPRVYLMTHPEYEPSPGELARFHAMLDRRRSSEPLQYVLGDAAFRHLTLRVRPGVLIPRAETEVLVDHAWAALQRWRTRHGEIARGGGVARGGEMVRPWVIDVGVGSGAIVLAIIYEALAAARGTVDQPGAHAAAGRVEDQPRPDTDPAVVDVEALWFRPLGIDISPIPLAMTAENADLNRLPRPHLALGDYLATIRTGPRPAELVAGIVSNPPYIATTEMSELPAEIREYEPHEALHAGPDGLGAIRILLDQARPFLERGAFLCFEIGGLQADAVRRELVDRGFSDLARIHTDLAGRPRVVLIEAD